MHLYHNHPADLLARDGHNLILQSDDPLAGRTWVEAWVAGETIQIKLEIQAEVQTSKEELPAPWLDELLLRLQRPPRKHLFRAKVRRPAEFIPYLDILLDPTPNHVEHRTAKRAGHHVRVMSPELPDFRGTLRNLSETGIGLDLTGPVTRGSRLHLKLEPDGGQDTPFEIEAEVCWCRSTVEGERAPDEHGRTHAYEMGARFLPLSETASQLLREFLTSLNKLGLVVPAQEEVDRVT